MKISVKQEHISAGTPGHSFYCRIALACRKAFGGNDIYASDEAVNFILDYDLVEPFDFEIGQLP